MGLFFSSFFLVLGWIIVEEILEGGFVRLGEVGTFMTIMMKWLGIKLFAEQAQQLSQVIGRFLFPSGFFSTIPSFLGLSLVQSWITVQVRTLNSEVAVWAWD